MENRQIFGLILLGAIVGLGFVVVKPFLAPLTWAAILAYVTGPWHQRILRLTQDRLSLAAAIATLLLIVALLVPVAFLLIRLQSELADTYRELSVKYADEPLVMPQGLVNIPFIGPALEEAVTRIWNDPELRKQQLNEWLGPWVREFAGIVGAIGRTAVQFAISGMALFFFYRDGDAILEEILRGLRKVVGAPADHYFSAVGDAARAVVFGLMISALAQGFVAGVGYAILDIGPPMLLGSLTGLMALVPFLGTVAVWGPISVWLLLSDQIAPAVELLAWGAIIVNPIDNILKPLLISNATDIPLLLVLFGVMGGLLAFGLVGLFLGPLILSVVLAIWRQWLAQDESSGAHGS